MNKYYQDNNTKEPEDQIALINEKIQEYQSLVSELKTSNAWLRILNDVNEQIAVLDRNWQNLTDANDVLSARVQKMALVYIQNLVRNYEDLLKNLNIELIRRTDPDSFIEKDYDNIV